MTEAILEAEISATQQRLHWLMDSFLGSINGITPPRIPCNACGLPLLEEDQEHPCYDELDYGACWWHDNDQQHRFFIAEFHGEDDGEKVNHKIGICMCGATQVETLGA